MRIRAWILRCPHADQAWAYFSYDNLMMEFFWNTLPLEVHATKTWETRTGRANAIFEWTEHSFNIDGVGHSETGMPNPVDVEAALPPPCPRRIITDLPGAFVSGGQAQCRSRTCSFLERLWCADGSRRTK